MTSVSVASQPSPPPDLETDPVIAGLKAVRDGTLKTPAADAASAPAPAAGVPADDDPVITQLKAVRDGTYVPPAKTASATQETSWHLPTVPSLGDGPDLSHLTNRPVGGNLAAWWNGQQPPFNPPATPTAPGAALPDWAVHDQPVSAPAPPSKDTLENMAGAIPSGLYKGIAQVPNYPTYAVNAGLDVMGSLTGQNYGHLDAPINDNPTGYQPKGPIAQNIASGAEMASNTLATGAIGKVVSPFLRAGSTAAKVVNTVADTRPSTAVSAGVAGGVEKPIEDVAPDSLKPIVRAIEPVVVGGATSAGQTGAGNLLRGKPVPAGDIQLALQAKQMGIPVAAAELTDSRPISALKTVVSAVPGSGMGRLSDEAQTAVNQTAARLMGVNADKITPAVLNQARRVNGGEMERIENANNITVDPELQNNLATVLTNARASTTPEEFTTIQRVANGVMANARPATNQRSPTISGETYGNLMHAGSPLDAAASSANPNIANAARDIKAALSDALQRSLSGDDFASYQKAKTQWKVMKTLEPLAIGADIVNGPRISTGDINPIRLRQAVNNSYTNAAYAEPGQIPLNDLAMVSQRFLKEKPTSNTAENLGTIKLLTRIGEGGAALFGFHEGGHLLGYSDPQTAAVIAAGLGSTVAGARVAGSVLQSRWLANRMIDKALNPPPTMAESASRAAIPLATASGLRTLEPPPSINPATGLPQFSLSAAKKELADRAVDHMHSHAAITDHVNQNKQELRKTFGGQGIQNIHQIAAMVRRAGGDNTEPATLFSTIVHAASPALREAMDAAHVRDVHGLASLAIQRPELAKVLATKTMGKNLTKTGEARVISAIQ